MWAIFSAVVAEREKQDARWGFPQTRSHAEWGLILAEEAGEVMKEANEIHFRGKPTADLKAELIQVMAVCMSYIQHMYGGHVLPRQDSEFGRD